MKFYSRVRWKFALPWLTTAFCIGLYAGHEIVAQANEKQYWPNQTISIQDRSGWGVSLEKAVMQWNNANLGVQFVITQEPSADVIVGSSPSRCHRDCAAVTEFLGYRPGSQQYIFMSRWPNAWEKANASYWSIRVLVHELGHVLGLPHHSGCRVMSKHFAKDCRIRDENRAFVCGPLPADIRAAQDIYGVVERPRIPTGCRY